MCVICENKPITGNNLNVSQCSKITKITYIPNHLEMLFCFNCPNLEYICDIPDSVRIFYCSNTKIKKLPKLSQRLVQLDISYTKIKQLPELPPSLSLLWCQGLDIFSLPPHPETFSILNYSYCDNLVRFPTKYYTWSCRWGLSCNIKKVLQTQRWFRKRKFKRRLILRRELNKYLCKDLALFIVNQI